MPSAIPQFDAEIQEYIEQLLASGKSHQQTAVKVIVKYPHIAEQSELSYDEVLKRVIRRVYDTKTDTRRPSYYRIRDKQAQLLAELEGIEVSDPMFRLEILGQAFDKVSELVTTTEDDDILLRSVGVLLKVDAEIRKETQALIPPDKGTNTVASGDVPGEGTAFGAEGTNTQPGSADDLGDL